MANLVNHSLLYPSFLEDRRTYHLLEAYWRRQVQRVLADTDLSFQRFYNDRMGNGSKLYDANPIFDAYFPDRHKLVRILQFIPETGDRYMASWFETWPAADMEDDNRPQPTDTSKALQPIPELVIDLALTRETATQALRLIREWIVADRSAEQMEEVLSEG